MRGRTPHPKEHRRRLSPRPWVCLMPRSWGRATGRDAPRIMHPEHSPGSDPILSAGAACQRRLKSDPLAACEIEPPAWLIVLCGGRGDAAEVSVFEAIGVAFERDHFGVVDEPVDHRCGDDVVAEHLSPQRPKVLFDMTMSEARS